MASRHLALEVGTCLDSCQSRGQLRGVISAQTCTAMHTLDLGDGKVLLDHCTVSDATVNNVKSKKYWRIARESLKQFAHETLAPLVVRNVNYK